jgi:hypothetical protein
MKIYTTWHCKLYVSEEGFSLREGLLGWQWQETGADDWSAIYSSREAVLAAIAEDFPCEPFLLNPNFLEV